jgi:hypothetical protein
MKRVLISMQRKIINPGKIKLPADSNQYLGGYYPLFLEKMDNEKVRK